MPEVPPDREDHEDAPELTGFKVGGPVITARCPQCKTLLAPYECEVTADQDIIWKYRCWDCGHAFERLDERPKVITIGEKHTLNL